MAISTIIVILLIIADWYIFEKAGESGWKSLVPCYNTYVLFKISGCIKLFWMYLVYLISFVLVFLARINPYLLAESKFFLAVYIIVFIAGCGFAIYSSIKICIGLGKSFNKPSGFVVGLLLLPFIFRPILGFSNAQYCGQFISGNNGYNNRQIGNNRNNNGNYNANNVNYYGGNNGNNYGYAGLPDDVGPTINQKRPEYQSAAIVGAGGTAYGIYSPIGQGAVIGRSGDCGVVVSDGKVSGKHCRITMQNGRFYIVDLNSTNGTFVSGYGRLTPGEAVELKNGTSFSLGKDCIFTIKI